MSKPTCVIYAPIISYSGYGAKSRDISKSIINLYKDEWDIKIMACGWGGLPTTFIEDHKEWEFLNEYILNSPVRTQPDIMIWVTIPSEVQQAGKWNCLFTAGIETNACSPKWVESLNLMDLIIVPSEQSKRSFIDSSYQKQDKTTQQIIGNLVVEKPIEVLFEGFNPEVYKPVKLSEGGIIKDRVNDIPEDFCFLFTGMWLPGIYNEDRKNISGLVKVFLETFKNKKTKPALILKTSQGSPSIIDRNEVLEKIEQIKNTVNSKNLPNIYLFHGDVTDSEMNELYNHPKVKTMISLTKGEGFGRPLLEFTQSKKPIICSGWGGQIDFLKNDLTTLLPGSLTPIHKSAQMEDMLIDGSHWFSVDLEFTSKVLNDYFDNYKKYIVNGKKLSYYCKTNFTIYDMESKLKNIFDTHVKLPYQLKLPTIEKKQTNTTLPKLI